MRLLAAMGAIVLIVVAVVASIEGAFALVVGWIPFLGRVVPQVNPDEPTVVVGLAALLIFAIGVHWAGRSWRMRGGKSGRRWTIRSTASVVLGVVVLFAAGIAVIGIVHQTSWMATDDRPLQAEGLARRESPEIKVKMMSLAVGNYVDTMNTLPPGGTFTPQGDMLHSWETHILPYVSYDTHTIDMKRPWNDPVNQSNFQCVLPLFINSSFRTPPLQDAEGYGFSHFAANSRVMGANSAVRLSDLNNGAANTLLIGEVNADFKPWGHPVNWRDPAAGVGSSPRQFGGPAGAGGAQFLMADWSVRFVSEKTSPEVLRSLAGPRALGQ